MNTKLGIRRRSAGGAATGVLWVLLICAVAAAVGYVFLKRAPAQRPVAVSTPAPATPTPTPIPATPEPVVVKATPTPTPTPKIVVATPVPATPPQLEIASVVRTPSLWPPQVALVRAWPFPIIISGRAAGQANAPVGSVLRVLRVGAQQVEVEFQGARHLVPLEATDLMARALVTFRKNGSILPTPPPVAAAPAPSTPAPATVGNTNPVKLGERLLAEVTRNKRSRIEGGDFDDKKERIEMKVKLTNTDTKMGAEKLQGQIHVFGESILDRSAVRLLNLQDFEFSLPPRSTHEFITEEVMTMYDTTGARFGYRYEGWVLKVKDNSGNLVLAKTSSPSLLKLVDTAPGMAKNKSYDRTKGTEKEEGRLR